MRVAATGVHVPGVRRGTGHVQLRCTSRQPLPNFALFFCLSTLAFSGRDNLPATVTFKSCYMV